ncbi:MAG: response regulator [Chloroflexota bacterium]
MDKSGVLIIEDDLALAEIFSTILQYSGFDTEVISDGQVAMDRLENTSPDLVILDLHLPNVTGPLILEYIRGNEYLDQTKVIIATADLVLVQDVQSQADALLTKPISPSSLISTVKQLHPISLS